MAESYTRSNMRLNAVHNITLAATTFLHIHCFDEEGNDLAGAKFRCVLPDGQEIEGELDGEGWYKNDQVLRGEAIFYLVEDVVEGELGHFIDVVVKDEEGRPLEGEPYTLTLSDGETRQGTLDGDGRCREDDIPPGPCFFLLSHSVVGDTRHLRLQFMDEDQQPFAGKPFEIVIEGHDTISGHTSDEGRVIADVPAAADKGDLTIWLDEDKSGEKYSWPIKISEVSS